MAFDFTMKKILGKLAIAAALIFGGVVDVGQAQDRPEGVVVPIPGGEFVAGSDAREREFGYTLDETAYGHSVTRKNGWYDRERNRAKKILPAYSIMRDLVTNEQYLKFVEATGHAIPYISPSSWKKQGLIHPYNRVRRHLWKNGRFPEGRKRHPVVLVTWEDADAYAKWLTATTGRKWRIPSELEWEKAARGKEGRIFPWGNNWDPKRLNSHDKGPFDTVPVGSYPDGMSRFGINDVAGQVFEWTSSKVGNNRFLVKGGSWDDKGCGVCRAAARHSRPKSLKHILVGFRLVTSG